MMMYSGAVVDFNAEAMFHLVGNDVAEMIDALEELAEGYSVEFCMGNIWNTETGEIVATLEEIPGYQSGVWETTDGKSYEIPERQYC